MIGWYWFYMQALDFSDLEIILKPFTKRTNCDILRCVALLGCYYKMLFPFTNKFTCSIFIVFCPPACNANYVYGRNS